VKGINNIHQKTESDHWIQRMHIMDLRHRILGGESETRRLEFEPRSSNLEGFTQLSKFSTVVLE